MANTSRASIEADVARATIQASDATDAEKAEMLMEIAMDYNKTQTLTIFWRLLLSTKTVWPFVQMTRLIKARIGARLATAQMLLPAEDLPIFKMRAPVLKRHLKS